MKREIKKLLRSIDADRARGLVISHGQAMILQGLWLQVFGTGGCYYPDITDDDMIKDLREEV